MSLKFIKTIERNIRFKMSQISRGQVTPAESGIGIQFKRLESLDEASYENLLKEYIQLRNKIVQ